ncbi:Oidioi.mRNA.OKI2018_I69.PAR.g8712.t1.cds [Oikopleura dioica]|uniref:Oidioi.mRNA.OKI2018_I69.PAR.g8712.t1.cds n=1 Tax=Oikopleura dioica TaxID=34765 RepID=A0ABN7RLT0_OIKDI|nr:Oidioi.mRNA.OKI2018_I69.PAR.g8712.t1.cds [Oikopleura dioica]
MSELLRERDFLVQVGYCAYQLISNKISEIYIANGFADILRHLRMSESKTCDLSNFPAEVSLKVLKYLDATDLSLASCVWSELGSDGSVWENLCKRTWKIPDSLYKNKPKSWKSLYLLLDESCVQFNVEPEWGLKFLDEKELLKRTDSRGIAQFINGTTRLHWNQVRSFLTLRKNTDVLEHLTGMMNFKDQFLPTSLRKFFAMFHVPVLGDRQRMDTVLAIFSREFSTQNAQDSHVTFDGVSIIAYALVLLSVDQFALAGQIRNKMSKREFIKNTLRALENADASCEKFTSEVGDYYDNVYLLGHIAPEKWD